MALPKLEEIKKILETFYEKDNQVPSLDNLNSQLKSQLEVLASTNRKLRQAPNNDEQKQLVEQQQKLIEKTRDDLKHKEDALQEACKEIIKILQADHVESLKFDFKTLVEGILLSARKEQTQEKCINNFIGSLEQVLEKPSKPTSLPVKPLAIAQKPVGIVQEKIPTAWQNKLTSSAPSIHSFELKMLLAVVGGALIGASLIALAMFSIITGTGPLVGLALLTCVPMSVLVKATIITGAIVMVAPPISYTIYGFFSMLKPSKSISRPVNAMSTCSTTTFYPETDLLDPVDLIRKEPSEPWREDIKIINRDEFENLGEDTISSDEEESSFTP